MKTDFNTTKISTKDDLIIWANFVNRGMNIKMKVQMQDIYSRSALLDIKKAFLDSTVDERKVILCSVHNVMNYEEVERLLMFWATRKAQDIIDEERKFDTEEFVKKQNQLEETRLRYETQLTSLNNDRVNYHQKISDLAHEVSVQKAEKEKAIECMNEAKMQYNEFYQDAMQYRQIKSTLRGILA